MSHFSIAALQLALSNGNNLDHIVKSIEQAKRRFPWLDMLVLPELSTFGIDQSHAEQLPGLAESAYCELARKHNIWLVAGSQFEQDGDAIYNTCSIINNKGLVVDRYRKIFPFYPYEKNVSCGDKFVVIDVPQGRIGVGICYDLWFPEVARAMIAEGAECLVFPTLTGTIDRKLEVAMAKATAIQNQCYVITVNCVGDLGNGLSTVNGPEGDDIYLAGEKEEIIPIEIDFERVRRCRDRGVYNLGQPLKSLRDNPVEFPQNKQNRSEIRALVDLGPLKMPSQDEVNNGTKPE